MLLDRPYFMTNKDWYKTVQVDEFSVKKELTELGQSIPEVVKSFEEYQKQLNDYDPFPDMTRQMIKDAENSLREDYTKQGLTPEEIEKKVQEWKYKISHN